MITSLMLIKPTAYERLEDLAEAVSESNARVLSVFEKLNNANKRMHDVLQELIELNEKGEVDLIQDLLSSIGLAAKEFVPVTH
jgi:uncharacterized protein (DUF111 family)